jgi:hypothetical protein
MNMTNLYQNVFEVSYYYPKVHSLPPPSPPPTANGSPLFPIVKGSCANAIDGATIIIVEMIENEEIRNNFNFPSTLILDYT